MTLVEQADGHTLFHFETHATSRDNEDGIASGWSDPPLSRRGVTEALDLGARLSSVDFDAVLCSSLRRSRDTARIAFPKADNISCLDGLKECNYGLLNGATADKIDEWKVRSLSCPFPSGESFVEAAMRNWNTLRSFVGDNAGQRILVIGHRSTQHALEFRRTGSLSTAVRAHWVWRPGWVYWLK